MTHRKMKAKNLLKKTKTSINSYVGQILSSYRSLSYSFKTLLAGVFLFFLSIVFFLLFPLQNNPGTDQKVLAENHAIEKQFQLLKNNSPLDFTYNHEVEKYIQLFETTRKEDLSSFMERSNRYFPIIESYLDRYNIPLELKYLAVVESGLNPIAVSKSGAAGIWQFLYNTCALVDLKINSYVDERYDIYKSTDAACKYLNYLYKTFENWELAMAAYNCGPGTVRDAIELSGGEKDFWKINHLLPEQTANYIPAIYASAYLFEFPQYHSIRARSSEYPSNLDTIRVFSEIHFSRIEAFLDIPYNQINLFNPVYKKGVIPQSENGYALVLPRDKINRFKKYQDQIVNRSIPIPEKFFLAKKKSLNEKELIVHVVKRGEFFHKLAMQYNCSVDNIKQWNNIDTNTLSPGQKLKIWIEKEL